MAIYGLIILALDVYCIVHCIRRHRHSSWIFLVLIFPLIGGLIYLYSEALPEWRQRRLRDPANADPLRHRPAEKQQAAVGARQKSQLKDTLELAHQELEAQNYAQAVALYQRCLAGPLENDPELLLALAKAEFAQQNYAAALQALNKIRALTDYQPQQVRLLLARAYAADRQPEKAQRQFDILQKETNSLEVEFYYAQFLYRQGQPEKSRQLLEAIVSQAQPTSSTNQQPWLQEAQQALQNGWPGL